MLVYHGSPNKFDKFGYKNIGTNGTSEGYGFYFTDKKSIAENYTGNNAGYLYSVELKGKALSGNKRTVKKSEYVKLIKYLNEKTEYLSNYGEIAFEGFQVVMNCAIQSEWENAVDDADLLGGIITGSGDVELVCKAVYELLGYGYIVDDNPSWGQNEDGQNVYVALVNDIIKVVNVEKI